MFAIFHSPLTIYQKVLSMASESELEKVSVISTNVSFRKGVTQLLNNTKSVRAFECDCNIDAIGNTVLNSSTTVAVIEIQLPAMHELDIIVGLKNKFPDLGILAFTPEIDKLTIVELINSGVKGIILNKADLNQLQHAVLEMAESGYYFSPEIIANLNIDYTLSSQSSIELSKDEMIILKEIASGNIMIETCANGEYTSEQYEKLRVSVLEKTGCNSNAGLAVYSLMINQ